MLPPSKWTKFQPSLCDGCWANCCSGWPVEVTMGDLIRLGMIAEEDAARGPRKAVAPLLAAKLVQPKPGEPFVFNLGQKRNGDCIFLDDNRHCSRYDKRPEICRSFPKIGARPGYCPHRKREAKGC